MESKTENIKIEKAGGLTDQIPMVYKSNALVDAKFDLSGYENRILLCCIAQIQKGEHIDGNRVFRIKASDIMGWAGVTSAYAYTALKEACHSLQSKVVTLPYGLDGKPLKKGETATTVVAPSVQYFDGTATIALSFAPAIIPYISQLEGHYTRYQLADVMAMGSGHAMHLYEILIKKKHDQRVDISLEQLRFAFDMEDKYPQYKELKRRVIDPVVEEINRISPITLTWEPIKRGLRTVIGVSFCYRFKNPQPDDVPPLPPPLEVVRDNRTKAKRKPAAKPAPSNVHKRTDAGKPVKADGYKLFREQMQGKLKPKPEATTDFKDD